MREFVARKGGRTTRERIRGPIIGSTHRAKPGPRALARVPMLSGGKPWPRIKLSQLQQEGTEAE